MRTLYSGICVWLFSAALLSTTSQAQNFPAGFAQTRIAGPLRVQTAVAFAPDGRIFVAEQTGSVRIIKNNTLLATPFVTVPVDTRGERGLLGIAVDPDFMTNKWIYVYYTHTLNGSAPRNRVSRFTATNDVASGGETLILNLEPLGAALIHNAGALHFGPDGKLYVAVGENANTQSAQNLDSYNGKLLRINKDGSVPPGNPFTTGSEQRRRVWAYGLRNPFTFSIDKETGKIFVNDVGQGLWEEINDATVGGRNFGWPMTEGKFTQSTFPTLTNPVYAYAHGSGADGVGCAIVGGTFISPSNTNYPASYRGKYIFQDNCGNWLNMLDLSSGTAVRQPFVTGMIQNSLGLTMGIDGLMYFCARHGESLYKIVYNNTSVPTITNHPASVTVATGAPASFTVGALGTPPLSYQWQKNQQPIQGANGATYTIPQTTTDHSGSYRVVVSNTSGSVTSNAATLSVVNNALPVAEILTPLPSLTWAAGNTISFSGKGTDPDQGDLPASAMSWGINFHHDTHYHDQPPITGVASGTFTIPQEGETSDNVWYRIILTVTDALGFKSKDSVDIYPQKSTLNLATNPPGLQLTLDGQPFNTPGSVVSVEGVRRVLGVISPQTVNNQTYEFGSWSDGGTQTHTITTPADDASYTANFVVSQKTLFRAINVNGPALSIDGNNWEASAGAPNYSFVGNTFANQNVTLNPTTDANRANMIRSSIWFNPSIAIGNVPAGNYQIYIYTWEDNFSSTYSLLVEGATVLANAASGSAGSWKKSGPFPVNITDGTINIAATGVDATISGVEIWRVNPVGGAPTITNPLIDQIATVDTPFSYTFAANTFSPGTPGATLEYTATLSNDTPLPTWLTFNPATRTFSGTPATAQIGSIDIKVTATEGTASVSDIFKLTVSAPQTTTFYRAINVNGGALTIDGNNWEASTGAPNFSFVGATFANQNITLIPSTDANRANMIRSSIWFNPTAAIGGVPAGSYDIYVYSWEDNFASNFSLFIEGAAVVSNISSGPGGTWRKHGPYTRNITDGTINIAATGIDATISGVEIWRSGEPATPTPTLTNPLVDQTATAGTPFSYTFAANSFTPGQGGPAIVYTATLSNDSPLPAWLVFNPTSRNFSGTPPSSSTIDIKVTATQGTASVNDVFRLTVNPAPTSGFYRAINVNGSALVIDGNNWEASAGAPNYSSFGATFANQNIPLIPSTDANRGTMIRSLIWGNPSVTISAVPSGLYQIYVYTFEDNWSSNFSLSIEGATVVSNTPSGPGGTWKKLGPFQANIADGTINVSAVGPDATISGIEVWSGTQGSATARYATEETGAQDENGNLLFYPNPFSDKVTVEFTATRTGPARISMYDVRGVRIKSIFDGPVLKGDKGLYEVDPSNLPDGIYVLEMINGPHSERLKMMLVR